MVETGAITPAQRAQAAAKKPTVWRTAPNAPAQYFIDWLDGETRRLVGNPKQDLVIETTLDAQLERGDGVGDRQRPRVVEVELQARLRPALAHRAHQALDLPRVGPAHRVGEPDAAEPGAARLRPLLDLLEDRHHAARLDVAIDLQGNVKSGVLTALTGAPLRIGFVAARCREPLNAVFTNHRVLPPAAARHVVEQGLALLAPVGVRPAAVEFPLPLDPAAEARVNRPASASNVSRTSLAPGHTSRILPRKLPATCS